MCGVRATGLVHGFCCRALLDLFLSPNGYPRSQQSKGVLFHSAATVHSAMDYSTMAVNKEDVDSPITHGQIPVRSSTPLLV